MISRNRSGPTVAAMSIECTTSANSTVTCLYSAVAPGAAVGEPHSSQNFAVGRNSALHLVQANAAVMRLTIRRLPRKVVLFAGIRRLARHAVGQDAFFRVELFHAVSAPRVVGAGGTPNHGRAQQPGRGVGQ